jgi:hypothetical protein
MTLQVADERQEFRTSGWKELLALSVLFLYFLLSGYTLVDGEVGKGILGRVTYSDFLGLLIIFIAIISAGSYLLPIQYIAYLPFMLAALLSLVVSGSVSQGSIEYLIHLYIWCVSLAILNLIIISTNYVFDKIFLAYLTACFLLALGGLIQYLYMPNLFPSNVAGGVVGTFRNTGQSGSFFGLCLAVLVPAFLSGLLKKNPLNLFMFATILLAFLFTFKRAAYLGFGSGLILLLLLLMVFGSKQDKLRAVFIMIGLAVMVPLITLLFQWGVENIQYFEWRYRAKLGADAAEKVQEFLLKNVDATFQAFSDHPFLGTGWANIIGEYTEKHEIHSTYLSILAQLGLLGAFCYAFYIIILVRSVLLAAGRHSKEALFAFYFSPFLFGLMLSWGYTYHLRKREFWIAFALLTACCLIARRQAAISSFQSRQIVGSSQSRLRSETRFGGAR